MPSYTKINKVGHKQSSPWGLVQSITPVCKGIAFVSTSSHGGYRVAQGLAQAKFSPQELAVAAIRQGNYYYFEEDCAWCLVCLTFPEHFPREAWDDAVSSVNHWFPQLLQNATVLQNATHAQRAATL